MNADEFVVGQSAAQRSHTAGHPAQAHPDLLPQRTMVNPGNHCSPAIKMYKDRFTFSVSIIFLPILFILFSRARRSLHRLTLD